MTNEMTEHGQRDFVSSILNVPTGASLGYVHSYTFVRALHTIFLHITYT